MIILPYYAFILLGLVMAVLFFLAYVRASKAVLLITSILWLIPAAYEMWVLQSCTGECNVRVDLLLVFPTELLGLSALSVFAWKARNVG